MSYDPVSESIVFSMTLPATPGVERMVSEIQKSIEDHRKLVMLVYTASLKSFLGEPITPEEQAALDRFHADNEDWDVDD